MRKKPHLNERLARQGRLVVDDPQALRGGWRSLAPDCEKLWVELGCGKGRFTVETARQHPEALLVAVERVPDAMVIAAERAGEMGLTNVRFVDADAARLQEYFAPGEVDRVYLNFSDPWPSNRQAKRRLTHPDFLRTYARTLAPGGEIHFKTDNKDLFNWSLFQFPKAGYTLKDVTRDLHAQGVRGIMTDYEEKFHSQGVPICRCVAVRGATLSARLTLRKTGEGTFSARDSEGNEVGTARIGAEGTVEIAIHEPFRRRDYGTELLGLALEYCRDALGLTRCRVVCGREDVAAARTVLHYKATPEGVGEDADTRSYTIDLT